jgi:serine protease Do
VVADTKIGKSVPIILWRDGSERTTSVTLGELDEDETNEAKAGDEDAEDKHDDLPSTKVDGMKLSALTAEVRKRFGLDGETKGVLIVDIDPDSAAEEQGLRPGDIILRVHTSEVGTVEDVQAALKTAKDEKRDNALILVKRGDVTLYVTLPSELATKK